MHNYKMLNHSYWLNVVQNNLLEITALYRSFCKPQNMYSRLMSWLKHATHLRITTIISNDLQIWLNFSRLVEWRDVFPKKSFCKACSGFLGGRFELKPQRISFYLPYPSFSSVDDIFKMMLKTTHLNTTGSMYILETSSRGFSHKKVYICKH